MHSAIVGSTDSCGASRYSNLTGKPSSVLSTVAFSQPHRIIQPNKPVPTDVNANRINFYTDRTEMITKVSCG